MTMFINLLTSRSFDTKALVSISLFSEDICNSSKMEMWAKVLCNWLNSLYLSREVLAVARLGFVTGPSRIILEA